MTASLYGVEDQQPAIWVFLEQHGGELEPVSLELLSKGRELADVAGWKLDGLLMGFEVGRLAEEAFSHGADEVILAEHPLLADFTVEGHAHAACEAVTQGKPAILLLGATHDGRDLAGRLAVRLRTGLNADCTDLRLESGVLISEVSGFGGGVLALLAMEKHRPQMATVRPGVFRVAEPVPGREGSVIRVPISLTESMIRTRTVERVAGSSPDLTQTPALVVGGRGIEGRFDLLRELADLLGGEVGATRPPVDDGYIERERQIGQTGVVCRPKVAIVCGVSGAFHFTVGIQDADLIIAVNSDPEAPIFETADYCIVGDAFEIVPALVAALRAEREAAHA
jgi:electron transfer flavoprotein alpha subunit